MGSTLAVQLAVWGGRYTCVESANSLQQLPGDRLQRLSDLIDRSS
jgi:hypothetical protein